MSSGIIKMIVYQVGTHPTFRSIYNAPSQLLHATIEWRSLGNTMEMFTRSDPRSALLLPHTSPQNDRKTPQ